ncbi:winged helix-turn-helix domain-containing protein [Enterovibrio calviensis]|uniref:winged helix-turn-helix domain-containing protein n=1 Tax=Enterovibrio calviensis TaxID=91359 RepID=UPI0004843034|nr:winged helix-turn-helix domain-containing protein [Enterovibrio calviensis]
MPESSQLYSFSDAVYDTGKRTLSFSTGHSESLSPIAGKVFVYLLDNADISVSKDELFSACWGNAVVSDQSLTNVISTLRKSIKKSNNSDIKIKTISKVGYIISFDGNLTIGNVSNESVIENNSPAIEKEKSQAPSAEQEISENNQPKKKEIFSGVKESNKDELINTQHPSNEPLEDLKNTTSDVDKDNQCENDAENNASTRRLSAPLMISSCLLILMMVTMAVFSLKASDEKPYFVNQSEYAYSNTVGSIHVFSNKESEVEEGSSLLNGIKSSLPHTCELDVFLRLYPSIDHPSQNALYVFILTPKHTALNYAVSKYQSESSWIALEAFFSEANLLCQSSLS